MKNWLKKKIKKIYKKKQLKTRIAQWKTNIRQWKTDNIKINMEIDNINHYASFCFIWDVFSKEWF